MFGVVGWTSHTDANSASRSSSHIHQASHDTLLESSPAPPDRSTGSQSGLCSSFALFRSPLGFISALCDHHSMTLALRHLLHTDVSTDVTGICSSLEVPEKELDLWRSIILFSMVLAVFPLYQGEKVVTLKHCLFYCLRCFLLSFLLIINQSGASNIHYTNL